MVQVWPRTDNFLSGSTHYGSRLSQWIGCQAESAVHSHGILGDFDSDGVPFIFGKDVATDGPCGFLWREYQPEDVRVQLVSYLAWTAPSAISGASAFVEEVGPLARVTGGTLQFDATSQIHYADVTGYGFTREVDPLTLTQTWRLVRWNSGVRTVLASLPQNIGTIATNLTQPVGMELIVQEVTGVTVLSAIISQITIGTTAVSNFLLFPAVVDATPIKGSGRCGFIAGQDRFYTIVPGFDVRVREKIASWQVRNLAEEVLVRDEFVRTNKGASFQDTAEFGGVGNSVQQGFYHDVQGLQLFAAGRILRSTTVADSIEFEAPGLGSVPRFYHAISQRPADDQRVQNPKITAQFGNSGASGTVPVQGVGCLARGSAPTPTVDGAVGTFTGYTASIRTNNGGSYSATLSRWTSGSRVTIGTATPTGLSLATPFTVELSVRPQPGTGQDGPAELEVVLNGVRLNFTAEDDVPGLFSSSGIVTDGTDDRILFGPGEGIFAEYFDTARLVYVTKWEQGDTGPTETEDIWEDRPNVSVQGEGAEVGVLNSVARIVWPYRNDTSFDVVRTRTDGGQLWTLARLSRGFADYSDCISEPMGKSAFDAFQAFWDAHADGLPFRFNDPIDGTPRFMKFIPGSWRPQVLFRHVYQVRFGMEERA